MALLSLLAIIPRFSSAAPPSHGGGLEAQISSCSPVQDGSTIFLPARPIEKPATFSGTKFWALVFFLPFSATPYLTQLAAFQVRRLLGVIVQNQLSFQISLCLPIDPQTASAFSSAPLVPVMFLDSRSICLK